MDEDLLAAVMRRLGVGSNVGLYRGWGTPSLVWPEDRVQEGWQEPLQSRGIHSGRTQQS